LVKGKGKGFPLQAWNGSWGSRRLRLLDFLDFGTMKVVRSSPLRTGRLHPQEFSWYSFLEAQSTPGHMVPSVASEKIPSDTTGIDPETFRLVALTTTLPQALPSIGRVFKYKRCTRERHVLWRRETMNRNRILMVKHYLEDMEADNAKLNPR
jgi:hypothetical protein